MGIARKWVFPIIRILIFVAIAAALVKIAFFADPVETDAAMPTGEIVEPQVPVTLGTIQNDVTLQGTVAADDAVAIKATLAGEVRKVLVAQGQQVAVGTEILTIRSETVNPTDGTPVVKTITVTSPVAGTLSSFTALVGQQFAVGDDVGKVAPPTFSVTGSIAPEQQYRLLNQPTEAQVTITGGPAPFTCTGLTISAPVAGAEGSQGAASPTVRCAVPADVKVFPGLAAELVLAGGIAENVLTVPLTAVEGAAQTGNVYFVLPDGTTELRPVTLGINDGINVEVTGGVAEGDMILQFIPGAQSVDGGAFVGACNGPVVTDEAGNVIGCGG